jgi:hypothetical protein
VSLIARPHLGQPGLQGLEGLPVGLPCPQLCPRRGRPASSARRLHRRGGRHESRHDGVGDGPLVQDAPDRRRCAGATWGSCSAPSGTLGTTSQADTIRPQKRRVKPSAAASGRPPARAAPAHRCRRGGDRTARSPRRCPPPRPEGWTAGHAMAQCTPSRPPLVFRVRARGPIPAPRRRELSRIVCRRIVDKALLLAP